MRDEPEKEIVHRLEAFSDIVIGFSLAQLGLNLTIPAHARDLFAHVHGASALFGLVVTFVLVCGVWWSHHRLFRHLFVPTPITIFANFAALGGVIFLAYSMQLLVHFHFADSVAYAMYAGSYAWISLLFAAIAWNGLRLRGSRMTAQLRAESVRYATRLSIIAALFVALAILAATVGARQSILQWAIFAVVIALLGQRLVTRKPARTVSETASSSKDI